MNHVLGSSWIVALVGFNNVCFELRKNIFFQFFFLKFPINLKITHLPVKKNGELIGEPADNEHGDDGGDQSR